MKKGGERKRKKGRKGVEGGLRVTCMTFTCPFFFIPISDREAREHKGSLRGKKQFQYLTQKDFLRCKISILEYVSGANRMRINWKMNCPRWRIIFIELFRVIVRLGSASGRTCYCGDYFRSRSRKKIERF